VNTNDQNNKDLIPKSDKNANDELSKNRISENSLLVNIVKNEFCWKEAIETWLENFPLQEQQRLQSNLKTVDTSLLSFVF
jgi:hypothetical protein